MGAGTKAGAGDEDDGCTDGWTDGATTCGLRVAVDKCMDRWVRACVGESFM